MASIVRQSNNRKLIQFTDRNNNRKTIRLGKLSMRQASSFKIRIERLIYAAAINEPPDKDTTLWLRGLDSDLYDKIAKVGLVENRGNNILGVFIANYIQYRDVSKSTTNHYRLVQNNLIDYFSSDFNIRNIAKTDAEQWQTYLRKTGLSENTVSKRVKTAKQFFDAAIDEDIIYKNPFKGLDISFKVNEGKKVFISKDAIFKVIKQCSDPKTRLVVALARFGGMRCMSEPLALKWQDILWEQNKIIVNNIKTEHATGVPTRTMPLFPELLPFLKAAQRQASPGDEYIITGKEKLKFSYSGVRSRFRKLIKSAGLEIWPKLFNNLRSSRETELVKQFPRHIVCAWLGHDEAIAKKHYLQVTEEDFKLAAEGKTSLAEQHK